MLHQVRRVLPWAKEAIGPSARCCLYIKSCEESKKNIRLNSDDCLECAPWIKTPYKFRLNSDDNNPRKAEDTEVIAYGL